MTGELGAYPTVAALGIAGVAGTLTLHALATRGLRRARPPRPAGTRLARALAIAIVVCTVATAGTALVAVWRTGEVGGRALYFHVALGSALTLGLAPFALTFARSCRPGTASPRDRLGPLGKLSFWLVLISGVLTAGTFLLATLPAFGTVALLDLIAAHRFSGIALLLAALLHGYAIVAERG